METEGILSGSSMDLTTTETVISSNEPRGLYNQNTNKEATRFFYTTLVLLVVTGPTGLISSLYILIKTVLIKSKRPMHIFTINRSLVDLFVCGIVIPVIICGMVVSRMSGNITDQFCLIIISLVASGIALSYAANSAVAVYCYIKCVFVKTPNWEAELRHITAGLCSLWGFYILLEIISIVTAEYGFNSAARFCVERDNSAYEYASLFIQSFLPNIMTFLSYLGIWKHWKFSKKQFVDNLLNLANQKKNIKVTLKMFWGSLLLFLMSVALATAYFIWNFSVNTFVAVSFLTNLTLMLSACQSVYYVFTLNHLKGNFFRRKRISPQPDAVD